MSLAAAYTPETLTRMSAVYRNAFQELRLQSASRTEHERLAGCILALGNSHADPHRMLAKAVQNYLRGCQLSLRRQVQTSKAAV